MSTPSQGEKPGAGSRWDSAEARRIIESYRGLDGALLPMLHALQDRFGDLGTGRRPGQSAADRLAELDETLPEREPERRGPPESARPSGRYAWVIGVAAIILGTRDTEPVA